MDEQRRLLLGKNNSDPNSSGEEWSNGESSEESYYTDSDSSSIPEWESSVDDITGELLYIDCHPFVTQNNVESTTKVSKENPVPFSKGQLRRSTRGKFLRLIRRRDSKRRSRRYQRTQCTVDTSTSNKVKFQDSQEGEEKEVVLKLNNESGQTFGRNVNLSEQLLGISVSTLSDGTRVMIAGFLPDSEAKHEKNIKIGDWLKSIDNMHVTFQNLNSVIEKVLDKREVHIKLQRVAGVEVTKDPPINELNCQSRFVRQLVNASNDEQMLFDVFCQYPIGVLYLNLNNLSESSAEYEDVIYCYPKPFQKSILCNSRGIFITLNHLICDITKSATKNSTLLFQNKICHVIYTSFNSNLLLLMLPDICRSIKEAVLINSEVIKMLELLYESLDKCFTLESNRSQVDNFFCRFFTRMLNNGVWTTSEDFLTSSNVQDRNNQVSQVQFEGVLPAACTLTLPSEAEMQIGDALTELEASDYREWNEEPLDCQRLFTILGSALYHYGYLLSTHLIYDDLIDVHLFCRQQGLLHLSRTEPVKTMVLWKEVFPHSLNKTGKKVEGRRYVLVVGSKKDLLVVIMEAGGCTESAEDNIGPDAFYVEEAQATLAHIQELGVPELADRLIATNPGPQITIPETCNKRRSDFIDTFSKSIANYKEKKPEVTSILKRRNSDQAIAAHSSSMYSPMDEHGDVYAEDSESQGGHSEISDDVATRKLEGERKTKYDSNDEDSDADGYTDGSQISNSSFDISELRQTLLSEAEDILPQQLTAGKENVLFHYVQFDSTEGVLVCPPECRLKSQTLDLILANFRESCHKFHSLFQNTLRFKNMPAQDMAKSVMNKSLIAIKEHGVMFECPFLENMDSNKKSKIKFWVIGRLFYMPHPREVYVCYQDNIPQNLIELAFKIDLTNMG